jgi:homocysteine S-methyltransferase
MAEITLLDGSIGQELVKRSSAGPTPLWSTRVLIDQPDLVSAVHQDYADAGATVATTNSYALHRDRLNTETNHYASSENGIPDLEAAYFDLISASVAAADPVRAVSRIAGSIGPLGASYRADLHPASDVAVSLFAEIAERMASGVDLFMFETIPSLQAGRDAILSVRDLGKPVWLAFTVSDEDGTLLRSGEPVSDILALSSEVDALLINCSVPEAISTALDLLTTSSCPIGAYANGFTKISDAFKSGGATVEALTARQDLSPSAYADFALDWVSKGAAIVGGCCEVGPDHIRELASRLRSSGHILV